MGCPYFLYLYMRSFGSWLFFVHVVFCQGLLSQAVSPPVSLDGKGYQFSIAGGYSWTVPLERVFDSGSYDEGFSGSLLGADQPYMYANGVVTTDGGDELRLTFTSATSGTYQYWELDDGEPELEEVGTFSEVTPSLELKDDWQHTATMDSALSTNYWNSEHYSIDSLEYSDGELSFLFGDGGYSNENQGELGVKYARTLPLDENWQLVLDDIYVSDLVGYFDVRLDFEVLGTDFGWEFKYTNKDLGVPFVRAKVSNAQGTDFAANYSDDRIANRLSLRVLHIASSRELVFEYQPDGASEWTELARLNLEIGSFSTEYATHSNGEFGSFNEFTDQLVSTSQRGFFNVEVDVGQATSSGELTIDSIGISSYAIDSDGDGLDDSVETNTGVYVSASDTGTNPQLADSSGDGFTDGEVVSAGLSPVVDYSSLLAIVRNNPERFELEDTNSTVDMKLRGLRLERAGNGAFNMNFDLEMSTDLQTWTPHTSHSIELSVPDQSKAFMRLKLE